MPAACLDAHAMVYADASSILAVVHTIVVTVLYVVWPFLAALYVRFPNRNALRWEPSYRLYSKPNVEAAIVRVEGRLPPVS